MCVGVNVCACVRSVCVPPFTHLSYALCPVPPIFLLSFLTTPLSVSHTTSPPSSSATTTDTPTTTNTVTHTTTTTVSQPTNHLDHASVAWLTQYLQSQQEVTCLIVSHDTLFLDNVVTDIIHYETVRSTILSYSLYPFCNIQYISIQFF